MPEVTPDSGSPSAPPTPSAQELLDARAWSTGRQIRVVAILAVGVIAAVLLFWLGGSLFHKQEAAAAGPASPAGTFRASEQQLKTFIIETIAKHDFASDELTVDPPFENCHTTELASCTINVPPAVKARCICI